MTGVKLGRLFYIFEFHKVVQQYIWDGHSVTDT